MSRLDEIKARYDWKYAGLIADDFKWLIVELEKAREELRKADEMERELRHLCYLAKLEGGPSNDRQQET